MGKGKRLRKEKAEGLRKPNETRWSEIKPGMMLSIPKFGAVKLGAMPMMIPSPNRAKHLGIKITADGE